MLFFATNPRLAAEIHCSHSNRCVSLLEFDFICYGCSGILRRFGKRNRIRVRGVLSGLKVSEHLLLVSGPGQQRRIKTCSLQQSQWPQFSTLNLNRQKASQVCVFLMGLQRFLVNGVARKVQDGLCIACLRSSLPSEAMEILHCIGLCSIPRSV